MRPARHKFPNAILSDRGRAHDLDRRAIVQGSDQDLDMLRFPVISQWTCHRSKIARKMRSSGLCPPRTGSSAKLADGPASAIRNSNQTSDPWHAFHRATSQNGRRARLHDVGGQKERWRAHCCHVLPRVSEHPKSLSRKAPLRIVRCHVTGSQPRLRKTRNIWVVLLISAEASSRRLAVVHVIGHKLQHNSAKRA